MEVYGAGPVLGQRLGLVVVPHWFLFPLAPPTLGLEHGVVETFSVSSDLDGEELDSGGCGGTETDTRDTSDTDQKLQQKKSFNAFLSA